MGNPPRQSWLNSTTLGIGLASLCSDVGHEMATTAMPALLASVGASAAAAEMLPKPVRGTGFGMLAAVKDGSNALRLDSRAKML